MGQNSSAEIRAKFIDVVMYNVIMCVKRMPPTQSIKTYKQLLLYIFSPTSYQIENNPAANKIKVQFLGIIGVTECTYNYCSQTYKYKKFKFKGKNNKTYTANKIDYFFEEMCVNREYCTLEIFYNMLKICKLQSLDLPIGLEIIEMLKDAITESIIRFSEDLLSLVNNLNRNIRPQITETRAEIKVYHDMMFNTIEILEHLKSLL